MKSIRVILFISVPFLFSGCPARSIHPLFTDKEAVFNTSLLGIWSNNEESYTFENLHEKNYRLVVRPKEENDSAVYTVLLGKIGEAWFLDSYPIVNSNEHHYLSAHVFTRMILQGDSLYMASLEADWLLKMITEKKIKVAHVRRENEIILTASTKNLQQFINTISTNNEAFPNQSVFVRMR
jgi:hypothetical protein